MNKKIISVAVTAAMALQLGTAFADVSYDKIPEFLNSAQILTNAGELAKDTNVTRGEFAIYAVRMLGMSDTVNIAPNGIFADVTKDRADFNAINMLYCLGFVNGTDDFCFEPDRDVTVGEVSKILVNVMGYSNRVVNGDYMAVLSKNKIFKNVNVNDDGTINGENMQIVLYNLAEFNLNTDNVWDMTIDGKKNKLFMTERLGIYKTDGVVTDDGISSLYGETQTQPGRIIIDGVEYSDLTQTANLLGTYVEIYYKEEGSRNNIIYINTDEGIGDITQIDAEDIIRYTGNGYTYYDENEKEHSVYFGKDFKLIYNNVYYHSDEALTEAEFNKLMTPENGYVRVIKSADGKGDTVIVKNYKTVITGSVDSENKIITNKVPVKMKNAAGEEYYAYEKYDLSKADNILVKNANGSDMKLSSIIQDNVAEIAVSLDEKYADVIVCTDSVSGTINEIRDDIYTVGDKEYDLSDFAKAYIAYRKSVNKNIPAAGDAGTFSLNRKGEIAYFKTNGGDGMHFAYLCAVGDENSAMSNKVKLKLVLDNKEIKESVVADTVKLDGVKQTSGSVIKNKLCGGDGTDFRGKIIRVKYNANDEINFIDTPYYTADGNPNARYETDDSLHIISSVGEAQKSWFSNSASSINSKILFDVDTALFVVPTRDTDEKQILVSDFQSGYNNTAWRYPTAYAVEDNSMMADVVVFTVGYSGTDVNDKDIAESCRPYIVKSVENVLDEFGDEVVKFTFTQGTGDVIKYGKDTDCVEYTHTDGNVYKVSEGDIVQFGSDKDGKIDKGNIRIFYDYETQKHLMTKVVTDSSDRPNKRAVEVYTGYINRISPKGFELALKDPSANTLSEDDKLLFSMTTPNILVYDKGARVKLQNGKSADLIDYETGGNSASKVAVYTSSGILQFILIYK